MRSKYLLTAANLRSGATRDDIPPQAVSAFCCCTLSLNAHLTNNNKLPLRYFRTEFLGRELAMLVESVFDCGDTFPEICGTHRTRNAAGDSRAMCPRDTAQRLFPERSQAPVHLQHHLCR